MRPQTYKFDCAEAGNTESDNYSVGLCWSSMWHWGRGLLSMIALSACTGPLESLYMTSDGDGPTMTSSLLLPPVTSLTVQDGDSVSLRCVSRGGCPAPRLRVRGGQTEVTSSFRRTNHRTLFLAPPPQYCDDRVCLFVSLSVCHMELTSWFLSSSRLCAGPRIRGSQRVLAASVVFTDESTRVL